MAILQRNKILEIIENRELVIESTDPRVPFDSDEQIVSDTIDLRLYPRVLVYSEGMDAVDTLYNDPDQYFEIEPLPLTGYILEPGQAVFGSALEIVSIRGGNYTGRISSRGTFSRFGISVTCGRLSLPVNNPCTPDVQILNNSLKPIIIYPYSYILQLQIETTRGNPEPYTGEYPKTIGPIPPILSNRDKSVQEILRKLKDEDQNNNLTDPTTSREIVEKVDETAVPRRKQWFRLSIFSKAKVATTLILGVILALIGNLFINTLSGVVWQFPKSLSLGLMLLLILLLIGISIAIAISDESD